MLWELWFFQLFQVNVCICSSRYLFKTHYWDPWGAGRRPSQRLSQAPASFASVCPWPLNCRFLGCGRGRWVSRWEVKWPPFTSQMPQGDKPLGPRYATLALHVPGRGPREAEEAECFCLSAVSGAWCLVSSPSTGERIETRKWYALLGINTTGYKLQEAKVHHLSRSVLYLEQLILCQAYALLLPFVLGFCLSVFCFLFLSIVFSACYH